MAPHEVEMLRLQLDQTNATLDCNGKKLDKLMTAVCGDELTGHKGHATRIHDLEQAESRRAQRDGQIMRLLYTGVGTGVTALLAFIVKLYFTK